MPDNITTITDANFTDVVSSGTPTLVDFWAEWCGPCRMIAPTLEQIAADYADRITVGKLNVDENPNSAMENDVMSIPTLIVFQDGIEKKRIVGARSKAALLDDLHEFVG